MVTVVDKPIQTIEQYKNYTHMSTSRTRELWIISLNFSNADILVVKLYYSSTKWYHWGKLGKVYKKKSLHYFLQKHMNLHSSWEFSGGPMAMTPHSQCSGPRSTPWSGNWVPQAATESLHTTTKDPAHHHKDRRSCVPQP